jgi:hypothetical protein
VELPSDIYPLIRETKCLFMFVMCYWRACLVSPSPPAWKVTTLFSLYIYAERIETLHSFIRGPLPLRVARQGGLGVEPRIKNCDLSSAVIPDLPLSEFITLSLKNKTYIGIR